MILAKYYVKWDDNIIITLVEGWVNIIVEIKHI